MGTYGKSGGFGRWRELAPALGLVMLLIAGCGGGGGGGSTASAGTTSPGSSVSSSSSSKTSSASSSSSSSSSSSTSSSSSSSPSSSSTSSAPTAWLGQGWAFRGDTTQTTPGTPILSYSLTDGTSATVALTSSNGRFYSYGEGFALMSKQVTGDFTLTATLSSISVPLVYDSAKAFRLGVMLCDCAAGSTSVAPVMAMSALAMTVGATDYQPFFAARTTALSSGVGGTSVSQNFTGSLVSLGSTAAAVPQTLLKIVRSGTTITAYVSRDAGVSWTDSGSSIGSIASLPAAVRAGVFVASDVSTKVTFTNITISQP
ncbi:MAG: hypothetical protein QM776_18565 [Rhodocyclaceae bacterium]